MAPDLNHILVEDRFIHVYGLFYPESDRLKFEAKHLLLFGRGKELRFEEQNWWIHQIQQLLNFYLEAQFQVVEGEKIDFKKFRTDLSAEGKKTRRSPESGYHFKVDLWIRHRLHDDWRRTGP
jgi:hypothetical protein